ncbi:MAG: SDR family oxidoreductase [Anaerolineales bacterium]|nr:SDR family oxidoreductase [Anaerolineales bacterium]
MKEKSLQGKIALVTGSYRNLGLVTAETLASYGASIVLNDIDHPDLEEIGKQALERINGMGVQAIAIPADMSKSDQVRAMCHSAIQHFGKVDILVNNAGPFNMDPYLSLREEIYDLVMDVNLKAIYLTSQEIIPIMKSHGWGRIVNMSAGSAYVRDHSVYGLAKYGVQFITEELALEAGPEVTVNAIAPGQIYESLPDINKLDPTFGERYTAKSPLRTLVTRKEVAALIASICTPAYDKVTGSIFKIDAGAEIWRF